MTCIPYHRGSPPESHERPELRHAPRAMTPLPEPAAAPAFTVFFWTQAFRPAHRVTVRNAVDGWTRDIYGTYRDGSWRFIFGLPTILPGST